MKKYILQYAPHGSKHLNSKIKLTYVKGRLKDRIRRLFHKDELKEYIFIYPNGMRRKTTQREMRIFDDRVELYSYEYKNSYILIPVK